MQRLGVSRITIQHQNPGATMPLVMPVQLICNSPETLIAKHVRHNSRDPRIPWLTEKPAHDTPAVICGMGPSIADYLAEIKSRQDKGAHVFALNGAAKYLHDNGIMPDFQIIVDSRERTTKLVGPAMQHLFASQVHPTCFKMCPGATQFHMAVEDIDDLLPEKKPPHCLIGGGGSVAPTAAVIANALGYREIHCYGHDSSSRPAPEGERGFKSHVTPQPMNDGEAMCEVKFDGKVYICSLTMAYQADRFMQVAAALDAVGCKVAVYGYGLLPDRFNATPEAISEAEKYRRMWEHEAYRVTSPGETCVETFLEAAKPRKGATITDFGCGTGRAAVKLAEAGLVVTTLDITDNCRDTAALHMLFHLHDLREPVPFKTEYGFCADMMEHIPPDDVETVLRNILDAAPTTFFQINTMPDAMGVLIEQPLHLTVRPYTWWREVMFKKRLGCEVLWEDHDAIACQFLVTRNPSKEQL